MTLPESHRHDTSLVFVLLLTFLVICIFILVLSGLLRLLIIVISGEHRFGGGQYNAYDHGWHSKPPEHNV